MSAINAHTARRGLLAANLICMASMVIWAAGLVAANVVIPLLPPLPLSAVRMAMASAFLVPVWLGLEGGSVLRHANWGRGLAVGGMIGFGAVLLVVAQGMTDAVTVAIVAAATPVVGIALEVLLDQRRITIALILGLIFSLIGGVMALGGGIEGLGLGLGALLALVSVVAFTVGSRMTVTAFPDLTPLGRTTVTVVGATALVSIAAALSGPATDWSRIGLTEIAALMLFGIGGLAVSQVLWIMSVGRLGIGAAALHINAAPFYVMVILFAFGGQWNGFQAIGAAIVGFGVLIAQGILFPKLA
jgi:drug/metabolite transporter (DMT)-like permease